MHVLLGRVSIYDHDTLMRFFITIIRSPECAQYVEQVDCYVNPSEQAYAKRLGRDMAMLDSVFPHLRHCSMSRNSSPGCTSTVCVEPERGSHTMLLPISASAKRYLCPCSATSAAAPPCT